MATAELEMVAMDVRDRVYDAAGLRVKAARIEAAFKDLARQAHKLGESLDTEEQKAIGHAEAGEQQMLFETAGEAGLEEETRKLSILQSALGLAHCAMRAGDPQRALEAFRAAQRACEEQT